MWGHTNRHDEAGGLIYAQVGVIARLSLLSHNSSNNGGTQVILTESRLLATFGDVFHSLPRRLFLRYIFLKGNVVQLRSFFSREAYGTLVSLAPPGGPLTPEDVASERGGSPTDLARHLETGSGPLSRVPLSHAPHP